MASPAADGPVRSTNSASKSRWRVYHDDCLERLRRLRPNSVDAIVTDPPYGLEFMGNEWDRLSEQPAYVQRGGITDRPSSQALYGRADCPMQKWHESWARAALPVLRPGGYLLAFGGTRTYHRLLCAIEDAGFEIWDCIAWMYGSGFPKSLNVSRAIDRARAANASGLRLEDDRARAANASGLSPEEERFCSWMRDCSGLDGAACRRLFSSDRFLTGKVEIVNTATADSPRMARRAMVPTAAAWKAARSELPADIPGWVEALVKAPAQPPITHPSEWRTGRGEGTSGANEWAGWGTALKPAFEPIVVARKPFVGTDAQNVLCAGGLNGCPIELEYSGTLPAELRRVGSAAEAESPDCSCAACGASTFAGQRPRAADPPHGRRLVTPPLPTGMEHCEPARGVYISRFYYCAKASRRERNAGLPRGSVVNNHPTVKPIELLRWLLRLVTPPGGTILDPFAGSGTTGCAAVLERAHFVGIERETGYVEIARGRIRHWAERSWAGRR